MIHGKLTIREVLADEDRLWDLASELNKTTSEVTRALKVALKRPYRDEEDAIEDVLTYVPEDLRGKTVKDARDEKDLRELLVKWTDESLEDIEWTLSRTIGSKRIENTFKFNWPQPVRRSSPLKTKNISKAKVSSRSKKNAKSVSDAGARKVKATPTITPGSSTPAVFDYDVALSFAGEDRPQAEALALLLKKKGVRVFYDKYEEADLWGKDLYTHLVEVYTTKARFCVMILSQHYAKKLWTNHERKAAQARAFTESKEYILPIKIDDTPIPGILNTVGYVDLRHTTSAKIVELLLKKLK